jgi:hypothetical protein
LPWLDPWRSIVAQTYRGATEWGCNRDNVRFHCPRRLFAALHHASWNAGYFDFISYSAKFYLSE